MIEIISWYKTVLLQKRSSMHLLNNHYVPHPSLRILSALSP